jgi:hypothetical protein
MQIKVGDFLVRKEGNETEIAVVKEYFEKHDFYELCIIGVNRLFSSSIPDTVYQTTANFSEWELEKGWKKFNSEAWYALGQIS